MSLRAHVPQPRLEAAPGEVAAVQVVLRNDHDTPAAVTLRVVGLDEAQVPRAVVATVPGGAEVSCLVPVPVPAALGIGEHAAAVEALSDRPDERPVLAAFTVAIGSVDEVDLLAVPRTVRGLRRRKLKLAVTNHEPYPVELDLGGGAPDVQVRFKPSHVRVLPEQYVVAKARLKGPRRWVGEAVQHNVVLTARGRADAAHTTAVFVQRPLFAHRLRMLLACLTVLGLWAGALGGAWWWWHNRTDDLKAGEGQVLQRDTDGDGVIDLLILDDGTRITAVDTDGDGQPDAFFDAEGNAVADPRGGGAGGGPGGSDGAGGGGSGGGGPGGGGPGGGGGPSAIRRPTTATIRGTVKAPGELTDIRITLEPVSLATGSTVSATPAGLRATGPGRALTPVPQVERGDGTPTKYWSARQGAVTDGTLNPIRQTEPVAPPPTFPGADGIWMFSDVAIRQTYQLTFSKPGFNTQSFVITPNDDGSATELDVEMVPGEGALAGHVRGPGGPLGGVEITVTDGTLRFSTTSATVGDVGSWSLQALSTPGVYSITARLRGYGTEVRQVELGPGQQVTGADLTMRAGVGSVSGRVTGASGAPLGGVTITASNGDVTRTTSTHTQGDVGAYNLPQLDLPGPYTLTVAAEGYLTETRRVPVNGAEAGVDFSLTPTTLTLTGRITSSAGGAGIPNAGLILTTGDLTFKASSTAAPIPGSFVIENLPPGNYTVEVQHYEHDTATSFVILTAGVTPPPLDVELVYNGGIADVGTGSVLVNVTDPNGLTPELRQVRGSTVKLVHTRTGQVHQLTQDSYSFRFDDLPVGTYTLTATAAKYNPAPARQVSIGLTQTTVEVTMLRLGSLYGKVVDSVITDPDGVTATPLRGPYLVRLYRQPEAAGAAPTYLGQAQSGNDVWQTQENLVLPGVYRVEIADDGSPEGYEVRNDQLLDDPAKIAQWLPTLTGPADMLVVFDGSTGDPVEVTSVKASRYPNLTGRVYKPAAVARTGSNPNGVAAVAIDGDFGMTVTCVTGGATTGTYTVPAAGRLDNTGGAGADSFLIDYKQVDLHNLTGTCQFTASASGYVDESYTMPSVTANLGPAYEDRRVHIGLVPAPPAISGTVDWHDGSGFIVLDDVTVSGAPFTGFTPNADLAVASPPALETAAVSDVSAGGAWDVTTQVFGTTTYTFDHSDFQDLAVDVTTDGTTVSAVSTDAAQGTVTGAASPFQVTLGRPIPRDLRGTVRVFSSAGDTIPFGDFRITATRPGGALVVAEPAMLAPVVADLATACAGTDQKIVRLAPVTGTPANPTLGYTDLQYAVCNVSPGNWSISVVPADHFRPSPAVAVAVPPGPEATFVEVSLTEIAKLAGVDFTLRSIEGGIAGALDTFPAGTGPSVAYFDPVAGTYGPEIQLVRDGDVFSLYDVAVGADPEAYAPSQYLRLTVPGHDARAPVVVAGPGPDIFQAIDYGNDIWELAAISGRVLTVSLDVPIHGTISGSVLAPAAPWVGGTQAVSGAGTVTAQRGSDAPISVTVEADGTFRFTGPEGYYTIEVDYDGYVVPSDPEFLTSGGSVPPPDLGDMYALTNDADNAIGAYLLPLRQGLLDLTVLRNLAGGDPVPQATWELVPTVTPARSEGEGDGLNPHGTLDDDADGDGRVLITVYPGTAYTLYIRELNGDGDEVAFPVITTLAFGSFSDDDPATRTIYVRAPLPIAAPEVSGTIQAVNSITPVPGAAPLPEETATPSLYELYVTYQLPKYEVTDTAGAETTGGLNASQSPWFADCDFTDATTHLSVTCLADIDDSAAATTGVVGYSFHGIPFGTWTITWDTDALEALGYGEPNPGAEGPTIVVDDWDDFTAPTYTSTVSNVRVEAKVVGNGELLEPSLTVLGTYTSATVVGDGAAAGTTLRWPSVPPSVTPYTLSVESPLHDDLVASVTVPVVPTPPSPAVATYAFAELMAPTGVRITGTAVACSAYTGPTCTSSAAITSSDVDATVRLVTSNGATTGTSPAWNGSGTGFSWDVVPLVPTSYWIYVAKDGFTPTWNQVSLTSTDLGKVKGAGVTTVDKLATFVVAISNDPLPAGLSVKLVEDASPDPIEHTVVPVDGVYTFRVARGSYRVEVSAPGYRDVRVPASGFTDAGVGATFSAGPYNITLLSRSITLTVSGPPAGTAVTVEGTIGTTDVSASATVGVSPANAVVSFSSLSGSPALPIDGAGTLVARATGYRYTAVSVPDQLTFADSATLRPVVTVSGQIGAPNGTTDYAGAGLVTIRSPKFGVAAPSDPADYDTFAVAVLSAPVDADEDGEQDEDGDGNPIWAYSYSLSGLSNHPDGSARTWTVTYAKLGVGSATADLVVSATSPATGAATVNLASVTPRDVSVAFQATAGGNGVNGVGITFAGTTQTTAGAGAAAGRTTFAVAENYAGSLAYTVSTAPTAYLLPAGGTVTGFPSTTAIAVPAIALSTRPAISGTYTPTGAAPTIRVCPASATMSQCNSGQALATGTAGGGNWSVSAASVQTLNPANTYTVWAFTTGGGAVAGHVTLSFDSSRNADLSATEIPMT